ncbi:MAG: sigma-70 family RNA polymerase sigma factor [Armatimonadetes bacterium]|nr:sigma-70 family RNA polymerase sigma factor [Armatimonadota bacterium]
MDQDIAPELVELAKAGDEQARDIILAKCKADVESVSRRFRSAQHPAEEFYADGHFGVREAIRLFNPQRGIPFRAFAIRQIRWHMIAAHLDFRGAKRHRKLCQLIQHTEEDLLVALGRQPSTVDIGECLGVNPVTVQVLLNLVINPDIASLEELGDIFGDLGAGDPWAHLLRKERKEAISRILRKDELLLVNDQLDGVPVRETAHKLGISTGNVRTRLYRVREKLKTRLTEDLW